MRLCLRSRTICYYIVTALCLIWISGVSGTYQCSCYTFDGRSITSWSYGKDQCRRQGGDLVSMETVEEWEFIKTQILNRTSEGYEEWWIGLEERDGRWKWLSNHSLTYNKWQPREPNKEENEKCVLIAKNYPNNTYGLFNNARCILRKGWICEYLKKDCSNKQVKWCYNSTTPTVTTASKTDLDQEVTTTTSTTTTTTTSAFTDSSTNTPYNNKHHHKLTNTDCLPYPLLVTAIFVNVLGGLTVLATVAFFLVPFVLKKTRSSISIV